MKQVFFSVLIVISFLPSLVHAQAVNEEDALKAWLQSSQTTPGTTNTTNNQNLINEFLNRDTNLSNLSPEDREFLKVRSNETASQYIERVARENRTRKDQGRTELPTLGVSTTQIPPNNGAIRPPLTGTPLVPDKFIQNRTSTKVNILDSIVNPSVFGKQQPLSALLNQLFYIGLVGAVLLAIVMIIRGGIEYMTIDAIASKENGKKRVQAALGGLVLAFSAILILNTINPGLTSLKITFEELKRIASITVSGGLVSGSRPETDANGNPVQVPSTPSGENAIDPLLTAYSPQAGGSQMEGGYASSKAGLDGKFTVRTLDDYVSGNSPYVTLAADPALYGKSYIIPQITYKNSSGQTVTLNNVKGYVHDTGSAFTGKGTSRIDIPVGKDYSASSLNSQPFSKQNIQFVPAK